MKVFLLSLLVAAAYAAPTPLDEDIGEPVELIVNGVPEGEPLEIGDVLGIKVKEHVEGVVVSATDLLHPLTAAGMEEIEADRPQEPLPEIPILPPIDVPESSPPEILPEPIEIPEAIVPELIPEAVEIPNPILPELNPEPIEIPEASLPEIIPPVEPEVGPQPQPPIDNFPELEPPVDNQPEIEQPIQPEPEQFPNGEIFNNGVVQVSLNAESGVISTVQSWFSMILNYINGYQVSSQQIV